MSTLSRLACMQHVIDGCVPALIIAESLVGKDLGYSSLYLKGICLNRYSPDRLEELQDHVGKQVRLSVGCDQAQPAETFVLTSWLA